MVHWLVQESLTTLSVSRSMAAHRASISQFHATEHGDAGRDERCCHAHSRRQWSARFYSSACSFAKKESHFTQCNALPQRPDHSDSLASSPSGQAHLRAAIFTAIDQQEKKDGIHLENPRLKQLKNHQNGAFPDGVCTDSLPVPSRRLRAHRFRSQGFYCSRWSKISSNITTWTLLALASTVRQNWCGSLALRLHMCLCGCIRHPWFHVFRIV